MVALVLYTDEFGPSIALELPPGWVRDLLEPSSGSFRSDGPSESALFGALAGSKPDSTLAPSTVTFVYLAGYDPGIDRPIDSECQLSIKYVTKQDVFGVRAAFDGGLIETVPGARDWLERAMPRVECEMDYRCRFWVTLSDTRGLGQ